VLSGNDIRQRNRHLGGCDGDRNWRVAKVIRFRKHDFDIAGLTGERGDPVRKLERSERNSGLRVEIGACAKVEMVGVGGAVFSVARGRGGLLGETGSNQSREQRGRHRRGG
jgi:hypothetical protein